jgi:nucleotide-binding universal stress UspA family protein
MTTIVVGYVPNALGDAALAAAIDEAGRRSAKLLVVNTTRADRLVDPTYADAADVTRLESVLAGAGVDFSIRHGISDGLAADDVLDAAEESGADLIVIGVRNRTPVGKLVMGSTAQTILLGASCNVLAVKQG